MVQARPVLPVVLGTALVLVTYVTPIVSVPVTAADIGAGGAARAWILSSMSLGLAAGLLAAGVLGDAFGRRLVYDVGLVLVAVGAVAVAVAGNATVVVLGRVVEGLGGAAVLACGLSLLAARFAPGPERLQATSAWGAAVGLGIASGSVLAAAAGEIGSGWREAYGISAVAALALLVLSGRLGSSRAEHPRRVDVPGLTLLVAGMTLLVSALTRARDGLDVATVLLAAAGLTALLVLAVVERRVAMPLVEPELLRNPSFVAATLGSLTLGVGMIGLASLTPIVAQLGLGSGVWTASLLAADWALVSVVMSLLLRRLPWTLHGPRGIARLLVLVAASQLLGLGLSSDSGVWRLYVVMAAAGVGTGLLNAVLGREAVASVPADRSAMGSGANNTARYLGAAVGVTLMVIVATHAGDSIVDGWNVAVVIASAATLLGAALIRVTARGLGAERG